MSKARSCCSRRRGAPARCAGSCRFRPTRSTAACPRARARNATSCGRATRTRPARPAPIGWPTATSRPTTCPVIVTRASNNYGPYQFPEKVLPLFVTNLVDDIPVPLYGDGGNVRDWLHVLDHCRAVDHLIDAGTNGEVYNIGGGNEVRNLDLTHRILELMDKPTSLIRPRAGSAGPRSPLRARHRRSCERLGWAPQVPFEEGLRETVDVVPRERMVVAPDQGARPRLQGVLRGAVRQRCLVPWRPARCGSDSGHRRRRLRRQPPARPARAGLDAARRLVSGPDASPPTPQSGRRARGWRSSCSIAMAVAARARRHRARVGGLSPRRRGARRAVVAAHARDLRGQRPRHASPLRRPARGSISRRASLVAGSATIYRPQARPIREDDAIGPASPYATSKLAQEMLARRAWEDDGMPTLIARSFNHVGPRQDPVVRRVGHRAADRAASKPGSRRRC